MSLPPGYETRLEQRLRQWMKMHDLQELPEAEMRGLLALAREVSERFSPEHNSYVAGVVASLVGAGYFWPDNPFHQYFRQYVAAVMAGRTPTLGIDLSPGSPPSADQMPPGLAEKLKGFLGH